MARWIKEEFEAVVTVLFVIITAALPWNITVASPGDLGTLYSFRWWIGEVRYLTSIGNFNGWSWTWDSIMRQSSAAVFQGYIAWGIGSTIFAVGLLISIILFVEQEALESRLPVRIGVGMLLIASGAALIFANFYIAMRGIPGTYVPVGGVFSLVFGAVLLTNRYRADGLIGVDSTGNSS